MAQYKITETSFVDNKLVRVDLDKSGDPVQPVIEVDDKVVPGSHWVPVDEAAKKAHKVMLAVEAKAAEEMAKAKAAGTTFLNALQHAAETVV